MEAQKYKELDDICKEMEKQMARDIQETLGRYCVVTVDYSCSRDEFQTMVETAFYDSTISAGCTIPTKEILNKTQDELREICVDYAGTMSTVLKDSMRRYGNEKGKA